MSMSYAKPPFIESLFPDDASLMRGQMAHYLALAWATSQQIATRIAVGK